jgi:gamma-glutamyltranspeptidase/glutathione hydrolase
MMNMIDYGMEPQTALDVPRIILMDGTANSEIKFEDGISLDTINTLKEMGHKVHPSIVKGSERSVFGRGQIIRRNPLTGVLWAASDPRGSLSFILYVKAFVTGDGLALGYC